MDQCLLVLITTPSMENALVDWLLDRDDIPGFTSIAANGHGGSIHALTAAEQVTGRQKQVMFQLHLAEAVAQTVIRSIKESFRGGSVHYWMAPLLLSGRVD